jgi:hypothetical protein
VGGSNQQAMCGATGQEVLLGEKVEGGALPAALAPAASPSARSDLDDDRGVSSELNRTQTASWRLAVARPLRGWENVAFYLIAIVF